MDGASLVFLQQTLASFSLFITRYIVVNTFTQWTWCSLESETDADDTVSRFFLSSVLLLHEHGWDANFGSKTSLAVKDSSPYPCVRCMFDQGYEALHCVIRDFCFFFEKYKIDKRKGCAGYSPSLGRHDAN